MDLLLFFIGLALAADQVAKKYDIYDKIERWSIKGPKLLHTIATCEFCLRHWLLVPIAALAYFVPEFYHVFAYPAIGAAILVRMDRSR